MSCDWHVMVLLMTLAFFVPAAPALGAGPEKQTRNDAVVQIAKSKTYYVAPDGSDQSPGTLERPLRTIKQALSMLRPGDTCILRAGRYLETVMIQGLQGTAARPITIRSYPDEEVILDGTMPMRTQWIPYERGIYQAQIDQPIWQLFVNGRSAYSARWPNGNWDDGSIWDKSRCMAWPEEVGSSFGRHTNKELGQFDFSLVGAIIIANAGSFKTYAARVTRHEMGSAQLFYDTTEVPEREGYGAYRHGYFLEGKLGLLDAENECFFDKEAGTLYYYPPAGQNLHALDIRGKVHAYAFDVRDSARIKLQGLQFFGTTFRFTQSHHCVVADCHLLYPSFSRRMLGDLSPIEITQMTMSNEFDSAHNVLRNCVIEYTDGPALEMNGVGNVVENNYIHDIDYSCTYKGGWTLNLIDAPELVFRRNTVHTAGASELFKAGRKNRIELNDLSRSGFLQNDGALLQISVKQQAGTIARYNWLHDSVKIGLRFDNSNRPGSPWGEGCRAHHNVAWRTQRNFFKGDKHFIHNNLCFDSEMNDLVISSDVTINGRNYATVTRNNIAGTLSGSRTKPAREFPVPGIVDHNWSSDVKGQDIRTQLRDPDNLDFRPQALSELVDGGAPLEGYAFAYTGQTPDIGPYEAGTPDYWIPGRQQTHPSRPIPPNDATQVKRDADLMWLDAYKAESHRVYWGNTKTGLQDGGAQVNNIYSPGPLEPNTTYYWRVDAMIESKTISSPLWSFTTDH